MRKRVLSFFCFLLGIFGSYVTANEQKLIVMRHGEAGHNVVNIYNSNPDNPAYIPMGLTEKGREQIQKTAQWLQSQGFNNNNIIAVFVSPLPRTRQTADELVQIGLVSKDKISVDDRLTELQAGDLEGKPKLSTWSSAIAKEHGSETDEQIQTRMLQFYHFLLKTYPQGNILVITHSIPGEILIAVAANKQVKLGLADAVVIALRKDKQ